MSQPKSSVDEPLAKPGTRVDLWAVCFAMVFPTLVTLVYFQWLKDSDSSLQQIAYGIGKLIQFAFPVVWVWLYYRGRLGRDASKRSLTASDLLVGIGFGMLVAISMFTIYFLLLANSDIATNLVDMVKEKVSGMGIDSFFKYVGLGIFYALGHSFLEEYYWRWFVFDLLQKFVSVPLANVISSLGFMAHHVVLLGFFFDWQWLTYPLSFCIAIGGMFWAWQYKKSGRLIAPWVSHMIVDAGIFSLGYFLIREVL